MQREVRIANYILAVLSAISLTLLSLPLAAPVQALKVCVRYVLNPAAYYGLKAADRLADVPSKMRDLLAADAENRLMHEKMKQMTWTKAEADSLKSENQRLRVELGLKAPQTHAPVWGHVMERDPMHWRRSIMIDAGAEDGVTINAPVLGQKGDQLVAIGRVVEIQGKAAMVLLLSDQLSSVAGYVTSPSTDNPRSFEGLIQGQNRARLRMNYLNPDAVIDKGDRIYTSPASATFPPDIPIGVVTEVYPPDQFLEWKAVEIAPAVEAAELKEVMILKTQPAASASAGP